MNGYITLFKGFILFIVISRKFYNYTIQNEQVIGPLMGVESNEANLGNVLVRLTFQNERVFLTERFIPCAIFEVNGSYSLIRHDFF